MATEVNTPIPAPEVNYSEDWVKQEERYVTALRSQLRSKYKGALVGETVKWQRADGYAVYMIVQEKPLQLCHVNLGDGYTIEHSLMRGLKLDDVAEMVRWEQAWKRSATEPNDLFYGSVKPGDIVHYSNGFGEWVRCEVVEDDEGIQGVKLLPIALVGGIKGEGRKGWFEWDLYRRNPDGSVSYGYHVKQIQNGETFQPHAGNIFEYEGFTDRNYGDPTTMPEMNLEPPDMTEDQMRVAPKAATLNLVRDLVDGVDMRDEASIDATIELIHTAVDPTR